MAQGDPQDQGVLIRQLQGTPWAEPVLLGAWYNSGGSDEVAGYRLIAGCLALRGMVAGGESGDTIFTLPAGFSPRAARSFPAIAYDSGFTAYPAELKVQADGDVSLYAPATSGAIEGLTLEVLCPL